MGSIIFTNFTVIFHMAPHSVDPGDEDRPYTTHQLQDQVDKSTADSLAGGISCANYNLKSLQVEDCPIDETSRLSVIVVGAGIGGITAGILLPQKVPGIELTILERHSDVVRDL
jgi:heterodisulfide reductase subunit A-like polyferredoxin